MFCQQCGAQLDAGARFCGACGQQTGTHPLAASQDRKEKLRNHLKILGVLWIVYSALILLASVMVLGFTEWLVPQMTKSMPPDPDTNMVFFVMRAVYAGLFFLFAIVGAFGIAGAWGLLQHLRWGRIVALIAAFISVFSFPLGTALAIYTFVILFAPGADENYRALSLSS